MIGLSGGRGHINAMGYTCLQARDYEKAIVIFKTNVERYPESANVYDSLGDAYENNGEPGTCQ